MEEKELSFRPELMRKGITYCLKEDCLAKGRCLRYLAFQHDKEVTSAYFVNPYQVPSNAKCSMFLSNKVERVGRGFRRALQQIPYGKVRKIRDEMMYTLSCGRSDYYRYMRGEKILTPQEEKEVELFFLDYGLKKEQIFDKYEDMYTLD